MPKNSIKPKTEIIPPQDLESEQAVLASLMIDKDAIVKVIDTLKPDDFYKKKNQIIYQSVLDLYSNQEPIDLLSVKNKLKAKKQLDSAGKASYLAEIINAPISTSNVSHYAKIVKKAATLRKLISAGSNIQDMGYNEEKEITETIDSAEKALFDVSTNVAGQEFVPISGALEEAFERFQNKDSRKGIETGFGDLDTIVGGFKKGALNILAARPSVGKTAFALDVARFTAVNHKTPVAIFAMEMAKEELIDKILCVEAGINLWKMQHGHLNSDSQGQDDEFTKLGDAMAKLSEAPIFINDTPAMNVLTMRIMARRLKAENNLGLIIIDYLQLMEGSTQNDNRVEVVSQISRDLKGLAKELNVPVLALSQLNRSVEQRPDKTPKLADLRESGSIEQDADIVMFLKRDISNQEDETIKTMAKLFLAKHRAGPTGEIDLYFNPDTASFQNLDTEHSDVI